MQAGKLATYDDLLAVPEGTRAEVIGGVLISRGHRLCRGSVYASFIAPAKPRRKLELPACG